MAFVKLDTGLLDSTLWVEDAITCKVFITILAMCDAEGLCRATAPGIARRANVSLEDARRALAILESPDKDSRSLEDEGRRVRRVDGGYLVVNYTKYRNKDHTASERKRRQRERKGKQGHTEMSRRDTVTVTHADTDTDTDAIERMDLMATNKPAAASEFSAAFVKAMTVYPHRSGDNPKRMAWQQWQRRVKEGVNENDMLNGTVRYACWCEYTRKINTELIMQARRFYGRERPFANDWTIPANGGTSKPTGALHRAAEALQNSWRQRDGDQHEAAEGGRGQLAAPAGS